MTCARGTSRQDVVAQLRRGGGVLFVRRIDPRRCFQRLFSCSRCHFASVAIVVQGFAVITGVLAVVPVCIVLSRAQRSLPARLPAPGGADREPCPEDKTPQDKFAMILDTSDENVAAARQAIIQVVQASDHNVAECLDAACLPKRARSLKVSAHLRQGLLRMRHDQSGSSRE